MENKTNFRRLGTMLDCSRNAVNNMLTLKKWMDIISDIGYNTMLLYMEDTYEIENQPYFGHFRGRYSGEELREIEDYATQKGLEFIPCIQTLAHLRTIFSWPCFGDVRDCHDTLLVGSEKTYQLIDDMFTTFEKNIRSRVINVGMDESFLLGAGSYYRINGLRPRMEIILEHLNRVADIAAKHGFEILIWGDMFLSILNEEAARKGGEISAEDFENVKKMIPRNVTLVYWNYDSGDVNVYDRDLKKYQAINEDVCFTGACWSWTGFAPHNALSMDVTTAALKACKQNAVKDVFLGVWRDDGSETSPFSVLPAVYYVAQIAQGNEDIESIKQGFYEKFGIKFDDFMLLDLEGTPTSLNRNNFNPEKYMFYNDCFMGKFDSTIREGDAAAYAECAKKLAKFESNKEYGYLFSNMRALCEFMSVKFDLGARTRKAYQAKDIEALKKLLADYDCAVELLEEFYSNFRKLWNIENKPFGFEVQDIRMGGLSKRISHCRECICDYIEGRVDRIAELEETSLNFFGDSSNPTGPNVMDGPRSINGWDGLVTSNAMHFYGV